MNPEDKRLQRKFAKAQGGKNARHDLRHVFHKEAVRAGLKHGDEGYYRVLNNLQTVMNAPYEKKRNNRFDHMPRVDRRFKWNKM